MKANKQKEEQSAQEKLVPYFSEHGLMGFKNQNEEVVLPAQWKVHCGGFSEGLAPVIDAATDKVGFIDPAGKLVIPYQWDDAMNFKMEGHEFKIPMACGAISTKMGNWLFHVSGRRTFCIAKTTAMRLWRTMKTGSE